MKREREAGSLLIEVMIALTLLALGILGFFTSFMSNARASGEVSSQDEVRVALENVVERLRSAPFNQIYANYQGAMLEVPPLEGGGGQSATAEVRFFVNEPAIPMEFGPIVDIDGVAGLTTADCSATYKLLPTLVTLRYAMRSGPITKFVYLILSD